MTFMYDPKDGKKTFAKGEYEASIEHARETKSKSNNDMLEIKVAVYDGPRKQLITDYITAPAGVWKLDQIAAAIGCTEEFNSGTFDVTKHIGANLRVRLGIEESDKYGDQNKILGYKAHQASSAPSLVEEDEEIPF